MAGFPELYREPLDGYVEQYLRPDAARMVDRTFLSMIVEHTLPWLEGPRVLELGYGDGMWTGALIERFGRSHLVDASAELLAQAREVHGAGVETYHSYFEELSVEEPFDTVIATYVLEHCIDPVLLLNQCRLCLRQEGLLLAIVPNATSLHRRLGVSMGLQPEITTLSPADLKIGHRRVYDAPTLEADLEAAGFGIERRFPMILKPLPNHLLTHLSPEQLRGLFDLGTELPQELSAVLAYFCRPLPQHED